VDMVEMCAGGHGLAFVRWDEGHDDRQIAGGPLDTGRGSIRISSR
jgi:hypothetical protein